MNKIKHILKKEFLVALRDIPSLAALFIMPVAFILIMSLAMGELFATHSQVRISTLIVSRDSGPQAEAFIASLERLGTFRLLRLEGETSLERIREKMLAEDYKFACIIQSGFTDFVTSREIRTDKPVMLLVNPTVSTQTQIIFKNAISAGLGKLRVLAFMDNIGRLLDAVKVDREALKRNLLAPDDASFEVGYVYRDKKALKVPSAVQQSVPAWLVFAMFFIVMPLSNTFIAERTQGTLARLMSMNVSRGSLLLGKVVPYFILNLIQVVLMLAVGSYGVPLLGGQALTLGHSPAGLALISACLSFSAISMALLIASLARTPEQAGIIGPILNILFGAIGGIMVPTFVMPGFMQDLAQVSPMYWGLEGFLDILLRDGGLRDILPESLILLAFGGVMLVLTAGVLKNKFEKSRSL